MTLVVGLMPAAAVAIVVVWFALAAALMIDQFVLEYIAVEADTLAVVAFGMGFESLYTAVLALALCSEIEHYYSHPIKQQLYLYMWRISTT